jgi:hypothetical protein
VGTACDSPAARTRGAASHANLFGRLSLARSRFFERRSLDEATTDRTITASRSRAPSANSAAIRVGHARERKHDLARRVAACAGARTIRAPQRVIGIARAAPMNRRGSQR